ncbi:coiled-coil domain-containing protein mad1 [Ceratobasidium sp. 395]|nr:coiled-coil domain-containing protein mad1 [Ceratobasidium sp. 395]
METRARTRQVGTKRDTLAAQLEEGKSKIYAYTIIASLILLDHLPDPTLSSTRRSQRAAQHASSMSKNLWERRLILAEDRISQLEAQIVERDAANARVQGENARLIEKERIAREGKLALETTVRSIKQDAELGKDALVAQVRELNAANAELLDAQESLSGTIQSLESTNSLLDRKLSTTAIELQASQAQVTAQQNLTLTLRAGLEDTQSELRTLKASVGGSAGARRDKEWAVVKEELARQTSHVTQLTRHNAQLTRQLQEHTNAELVREENNGLKAKVAELTAEVQRMARAESQLRAAAQAKAVAVESEKSIAEREAREAELVRLRVQNAALLDEVGELRSAKGSGKESGTKNVLGKEGEGREDEDTEAQIAELEADAERLRGMVAALQVKVRVGSEERKVLRGILSSTYPDVEGALTARIEQLENMLEQNDSENAADIGDMSMRSQIGDATFSTVRWEAVREREKREKAEEDIAELTAQIEAHEQSIETLEQTLFELKGEVAAGTHVQVKFTHELLTTRPKNLASQPKTRILQLADNPEARWFAMREEEVGRMREEITVLRGRVAEGGQVVHSSGGDDVPRETYENLQREKEELEEVVKQKEKRLLRLKSVFQSKAVEFRDSISSLLGYKLHFEPKHVRLTSVYDRDIDLKFASGGGNQASMGPIRIGGGAQNKEDIETQVLELKTIWVDQKQNVPCFLANLTLYAYERAELGLSDWAGLDG